MNAKHLLIIGCQLLLMTVCSEKTTAQNANAQFEKAKSTGNQEDVLELARILCGMYRTKDDLEGERNIAAVQLLALNLDSVPVHEQTTLLYAIQQLIPPSAGAAYLEVDKGHAEKTITDHDWLTSLRRAMELVPEQLEESLLKSLEEWNKRFPNKLVKSPDPNMFDFSVLRSRGSKFLIRAVRSTDSQIAESAFSMWCNKEREQFKSMQEVWASVLTSWNPTHRLEALDFYSKINSTWTGQLVRLHRLTTDSETSVAAKATELWTRQRNAASLLLETLATGTAIQRAGILESIDKKVVEEWGSLDPVTDLFNSPDIETRTAAAKACGRLSESIEPAMKAFETEVEAVVRQTILNETQFREFDEILFPRLAKAERAGLNTDKAMQKISAPYGFRPNHIYRQLNTESSRVKTLRLLGILLDNDPSDEATQMAIQVLEKLLTARGEDGQRLSLHHPLMDDFCSKHANRLSPIVPMLADNIESTKRHQGAEILVFFGQHAEPALPLLIRILEDDSRESQDCREAAIQTIRAMGGKGKPAGNALLTVIAKEDSLREEAAMAYLDIGCDPAPLFPAMGGYITVLAKIDPEKLVMIPGFQECIRAKIETDAPYDVLTWLGPHAEFLLPELKNKFQQLFPTPSSQTSEFDRLLDVIAELGPARQELVPLCLEKLKQEPVVPHIFFTAIKTLNRIGDDQRLAYDAIKALTQSPIEYVRNAAQKNLHSLYGE